MLGAQTPPSGDRCAASNEVAEISEQPYPTLFSPIEIGSVRLKNRVVHASISTRFADRGQVSDALIDYHANRARGGAAMIVTEPLNMHAGQRSATRVDVVAAASLDGLTRWADAVGAFDCHLLGQEVETVDQLQVAPGTADAGKEQGAAVQGAVADGRRVPIQ